MSFGLLSIDRFNKDVEIGFSQDFLLHKNYWTSHTVLSSLVGNLHFPGDGMGRRPQKIPQ